MGLGDEGLDTAVCPLEPNQFPRRQFALHTRRRRADGNHAPQIDTACASFSAARLVYTPASSDPGTMGMISAAPVATMISSWG